MEEAAVAGCVAALVEDFERIGSLTREHVHTVASRRGLEPHEVVKVVRELEALALLPTSTAPRPDLDGQGDISGPSETDNVTTSTDAVMPDKLFNHGILTPAEESSLGHRIQLGQKAAAAAAECPGSKQTPDAGALISDGIAARNEFVVSNTRLVNSIAIRHMGHAATMTQQDVFQAGVLGVIRAAEKFDPSLGYKFSTYATWWIRQSITRAIANEDTLIRLPVHVVEQVRRLESYAREFEIRNSRPPDLVDLAEGLSMEIGHVKALIDWSMPVARLDKVVDSGIEVGSTLGELVLSEVEPSPERQVMLRMLAEQIAVRLTNKLDQRSAHILRLRFGLETGEEMTLEAIGEIWGVTRERIRQLEKKALDVLRMDTELVALVRDYLSEGEV
ncbi:sigma-70 family RNA polymerase sigma factor [Catenulispora subtropica]|uniref:sigma-70 family RNA polymerase sigma factor n=1 Tax=Catenulispora subtropica TaxID=450798 RepID=UPI0031DB967A